MSSKIEVSRDDLLAAANRLSDRGQAAVAEPLWEALAAPTIECKSDPIIAVLKSNLANGVMPSFSGGDLKHLIKLLEALPEPSAQHQGEPVSGGLFNPSGHLIGIVPVGEAVDPGFPGFVIKSLYLHPAEQPAPVSVVLPSIDAVMKLVVDYQLNKNKNVTGTTNWAANIGMAVIDEVKRLNP